MKFLSSFQPGELQIHYQNKASGVPERVAAASRALQGEPVYDPDGDLYWRAFDVLASDRPMSQFGRGPIPFSAIDRFATRFGIDTPIAFETLLYIVRELDAAWLEAQNTATSSDKASKKK